jgi:hypothetical protein
MSEEHVKPPTAEEAKAALSREFKVEKSRWPDFQAHIAKLVARARKRGLDVNLQARLVSEGEEPLYRVVDDERRRVLDQAGRPVMQSFVIAELDGEAPTVPGWTFVAKLDHKSIPKVNLISQPPSCPITLSSSEIENYQHRRSNCDHCNVQRPRNETFMLQSTATGERRQIGRNCLADYIRSGDPQAYLRVWDWYENVLRSLHDSEGEDSEGGGEVGGRRPDRPLVDWLIDAVRLLRTQKWTYAYDDESKANFRSNLHRLYNPPPITTRAGVERELELLPLQQSDVDTADRIIEWMSAGAQAESTYRKNLAAIADYGFVPPRGINLVISAVPSYLRESGVLNVHRKHRQQVSEWQGSPGEKIVRAVSLVRSFGMFTILKDVDGNAYVARTRADLDPLAWDVVQANVESHDTYTYRKTGEETKQTRLKNIKVLQTFQGEEAEERARAYVATMADPEAAKAQRKLEKASLREIEKRREKARTPTFTEVGFAPTMLKTDQPFSSVIEANLLQHKDGSFELLAPADEGAFQALLAALDQADAYFSAQESESVTEPRKRLYAGVAKNVRQALKFIQHAKVQERQSNKIVEKPGEDYYGGSRFAWTYLHELRGDLEPLGLIYEENAIIAPSSIDQLRAIHDALDTNESVRRGGGYARDQILALIRQTERDEKRAREERRAAREAEKAEKSRQPPPAPTQKVRAGSLKTYAFQAESLSEGDKPAEDDNQQASFWERIQ